MASKLHNFFQQGKKIGGAGVSISCAAFEKEGHFSHHSEMTVILSFAKNHHKGELNSLRGKTWGICAQILCGHSDRMVIVISE